MPTHQRTCITYFCPSVWIHQVPFGPLHTHAFRYQYKNQETVNLASFSDYIHLTYISKLTSWMLCIIGLLHENIQYGTLQLQQYNFGQQPHVLSNTIEWVYTSFFHINFTQQLWNLPEEILFNHFMTTLNNTFEIKLAQEDEGYESGSESLNIPTLLRRAPQIYHISTSENLSFNPTTPLTTAEQHPVHSPQRFRYHSPVHHHLVFSSSDEETPVRPSDPCLWCSSTSDSSPVCRRAEPPPLPVQHHLNYHTSTPNTDQSFQMLQPKKFFPQLH